MYKVTPITGGGEVQYTACVEGVNEGVSEGVNVQFMY